MLRNSLVKLRIRCVLQSKDFQEIEAHNILLIDPAAPGLY
jgi:hypothetical protein